MFYEDDEDTLRRDPLSEREPASGRKKRDTIRECPDSKREHTAGTIIALAVLELYTR